MISSTSSQQMKLVAALQKKSKARKEHGLFVVEGLKMFLEAPEKWIYRVYVSESFEKNGANRAHLEGRRYEVVTDEVFGSISDTQTPQGVLALVKCPAYDLEQILGARNTIPHLVFLESLRDPGNLGTILRAGEGAGITGVIMDENTVDIFNPKVIRSTMGSIYRVPFLCSCSLKLAAAQAKSRGIRLYAAHLKGTSDYDQADYTGPCGFLIGNEANGLSEEAAALADSYIRIPMEGRVESLNAAVACSVLNFETARQRRMKNKG